MKFFFVKEDGLQKICKALEKIPRGKQVEISIDPDHPLFDNERRGKRLKEILEKRSIDATFITKTDKCRKFFEKIGLKTDHVETNKFLKILKNFYLFLFNIKKFQLNTMKSENEKKYGIFVVFGIEILFVLGILYLIYSLVVPNVKITINPAEDTETIIYNFRYYPANDTEYPEYSRFISIPYYTGNFEYKYSLSMNTLNIKYLQNPSIGEIKIINTTEEKFTFVPNTRFITDDGRLFQTTNYVELPAGHDGTPGEKVIKIKAMEQDDDGMLMGNRGNISRGTKLYIKNLKQSYYLKNIYAIAMDDFSGGSLDSEGQITAEDIEVLSGKLNSYISQQKKNIATQNFGYTNEILLTFPDTINYQIKDMEIPYNIGDNASLINGTITANIDYIYIKWDDLINAFSEYINKRPSEKTQLINIDKNSLVFFDSDGSKDEKNTFIVPTKIEIIQGYDFTKDINGIKEKIKAHIVGETKENARSFILDFPEIASIKIKIRPSRYHSIPKLKSRIKLITNIISN